MLFWSVYCLWVKHHSFLKEFRGCILSNRSSLLTNDVLLLLQRASTIRRVDSFKSVVSVENDNITLSRTYTLDGTPLDEVEIIFTPDSPSFSAQRVARYRSRGTTQVADDFQDRFVVIFNRQSINNANPSLAKIRQQNVWIECVPTKWN